MDARLQCPSAIDLEVMGRYHCCSSSFCKLRLHYAIKPSQHLLLLNPYKKPQHEGKQNFCSKNAQISENTTFEQREDFPINVKTFLGLFDQRKNLSWTF